MRRPTLFFLTAALFTSALAVFACTEPAKVSRLDAVDDEPDDPQPTRRDSGGGDLPGLPPGADPPLPDGGKPPGRVYAHTKDKLYLFDPLANSLSEVGPFSCVPRDQTKAYGSKENDAVIDLALDRLGNMYATTFWRFLKVDPTTGGCTVVRTDDKANQYPNSLSFVPVNGSEVLVGYSFDQFGDATIYTTIDINTGVMNDSGFNLNPDTPINGAEYGISGDFISLVRTNGKTYAAIKQVTGDAGAGNDLLAEIDPVTGTIKSIIGDTGQKGFYGLGFWAGKAYGFTSSGKIYEVDVTNGSSKIVLDAKDSNGVSVEWFGAGVTTDSPTAP